MVYVATYSITDIYCYASDMILNTVMLRIL